MSQLPQGPPTGSASRRTAATACRWRSVSDRTVFVSCSPISSMTLVHRVAPQRFWLPSSSAISMPSISSHGVIIIGNRYFAGGDPAFQLGARQADPVCALECSHVLSVYVALGCWAHWLSFRWCLKNRKGSAGPGDASSIASLGRQSHLVCVSRNDAVDPESQTYSYPSHLCHAHDTIRALRANFLFTNWPCARLDK